MLNNLNFNNGLASIFSLQHFHKGSWHFFKSVSVSFPHLDFSLFLSYEKKSISRRNEKKKDKKRWSYLLDPFSHLGQSFHPATSPALNQKAFHLQLFWDERTFATRSNSWFTSFIVVSWNSSTDGNATKYLHVIAHGGAEQTTDLLLLINCN